jgi:hypothetical protein
MWTLGVFSVVGLIGFAATFAMVMLRSPDAANPRALTAAQGKPGLPGDRGAAGLPGPAGPAGPRGPAGDAGVRILRADCSTGNCTVACAADEFLLNAYCNPGRAPAVYPTEHSATCRPPVRGTATVVAACVKASRR